MRDNNALPRTAWTMTTTAGIWPSPHITSFNAQRISSEFIWTLGVGARAGRESTLPHAPFCRAFVCKCHPWPPKKVPLCISQAQARTKIRYSTWLRSPHSSCLRRQASSGAYKQNPTTALQTKDMRPFDRRAVEGIPWAVFRKAPSEQFFVGMDFTIPHFRISALCFLKSFR